MSPEIKANHRHIIPTTESSYGNHMTNGTIYTSSDQSVKTAESMLLEQLLRNEDVSDVQLTKISKSAIVSQNNQNNQSNESIPHLSRSMREPEIGASSQRPSIIDANGVNVSSKPQPQKEELKLITPTLEETRRVEKANTELVKQELKQQTEISQKSKSEKFAGIQEAIDQEKMKSVQVKGVKKDLDSRSLALEVVKCRLSALYFIENYISVPVSGAMVSMKESEQWNATDKYKIIIELFQQYDSVLYMSSRQSGKTTTSAMYLLWCMIFFPGIQISYLTLDKTRALDMISRMKEMMDSIPKWMQVAPANRAERLSYYQLSNKSKITASFVSGSNDPDKVGRGLSSPIVFIDEAAFIPHAKVVWGALQPSVSAAKKFAKQNGYPNGVIFTSTPNGAGDNFFYSTYQNSVKFDDIYDYETQSLHHDYQKEFSKPSKNAFISVVLHWSEFRSQEWYEQQIKELNFDRRKVNQELDLAFLGSDTSIFSDEIIELLIPKKRVHRIKLPYGHEFDLYGELHPGEHYILGVDTAMSAGSNADYSAICLTRSSDGKPIGEFKERFSVVKRYAQVLKSLIQSLRNTYGLTSTSLSVVVERNSIGKEVVEELQYDESPFDFEEYLFHERDSKGNMIPGLYTSNSGKMGSGKRDRMFNMLMTMVNEKPYLIDGRELIDELRNLEQKTTGRIEASKGQHDDLVMAYNFTLYARRQLIDTGEIFVKGESGTKIEIDADLVQLALSAGNSMPSAPKPITPIQSNKQKEIPVIDINSLMNDDLAGTREISKGVYEKVSSEDNSLDVDDYFIF